MTVTKYTSLIPIQWRNDWSLSSRSPLGHGKYGCDASSNNSNKIITVSDKAQKCKYLGTHTHTNEICRNNLLNTTLCTPMLSQYSWHGRVHIHGTDVWVLMERTRVCNPRSRRSSLVVSPSVVSPRPRFHHRSRPHRGRYSKTHQTSLSSPTSLIETIFRSFG